MGSPKGCKSNGSCATGGCNRLNTHDWLADLPIPEDQRFDLVEVSFHNGGRKAIYRNPSRADILTGDLVTVESDGGFDVGRVSLSGELVKLRIQQTKRLRERRRRDFRRILRKARENDLDKLTEARAREGAVMIQARQIAREMGVPMKISDVDFQADGRKATFYYTAEKRIDFRDLVKRYASEFRIKVDMRQIGARQEAGKIGGIGSCGRELCCSTWLTEFSSVSTAAARYQNLAINQDKLSGQCGRLKCCLNYELDTYMSAIKKLPKGAKRIKTEEGEAILLKTDILRLRMYYRVKDIDDAETYALEPDRVRDMLELNKRGELAPSLSGMAIEEEEIEEENTEFVEEAHVSLRSLERSTRKRRSKGGRGRSGGPSGGKGGGQGSGRSGGGKGRKGPRSSDSDTRSASGESTSTRSKGGKGRGRSGGKRGGGGSGNQPQNEGSGSKDGSQRRSGRRRGGRRRGGGSGGGAGSGSGSGSGGSSGGGSGGSSGGGSGN